MPRSVVIALGVLLWAAFIAVFALHIAVDDPMGPTTDAWLAVLEGKK